MLTFTTIGPGSRTGEYLAGYFSPSSPTTFIPMVGGCPTEAIARSEATRLQREQDARASSATLDHHLRAVAHGFYNDES